MVQVDIVVRTTLRQAIAIQTDHSSPTGTHIASHSSSILIIRARRIAALIVRVVPHVTRTLTHTVIMKIYVASHTSSASVVASALLARRYTVLA